jgi:hypothetical protein
VAQQRGLTVGSDAESETGGEEEFEGGRRRDKADGNEVGADRLGGLRLVAEPPSPGIEGGGGNPLLVTEVKDGQIGLAEALEPLLPEASGSGIGRSRHGWFSVKERTNPQPTSSVKDVFRRTCTKLTDMETIK